MRSLCFLLFILLSFSISSQDTHSQDDRCGYEEWLEEYEALNPGYTEMLQKGLKDFAQKKISEKKSSAFVLIPVHVILVHPPGQAEGTGSNFPLIHVQSQIDVLNQDFGFYNSDASGVPPQFPAGDTGIQFCLASVDPDGAPTDGITRYGTNTSMANNAGRTEVIAATKWPREDYMNIWSAPNLPFLGLASVPSTGGLPNSNQDFVLVASTTFGGPGYGTDAPYDLGRTTTHEVGHWLGLFHIWGNGCASDDGIADTPDQQSSNFGCPNHPSPSCGNSGDMFMNYMDYVNDACMFSFSIGQGEYMNTILNTSRASLQGSAATACAFVVPLTISVLDQEDPNCFDSNDGFILVEAGGGSPNYSYSINGGATNNSGLFTDLAGGSYTIEVFDADGVSTSIMVFLDSPVPLDGDAEVTATNPCPDQSIAEITLSVSGGTNPYFFSINSGSNQQTPTFDGLANGFYSYLITDNNGCTIDGIVEIVGSDEIELSVDEAQNVTCNGGDDGSIDILATGGNGSLIYSLDGEDNQDENIFEGLQSGDYVVLVTDSLGCMDSIEVSLSEPTEVVVQSDITDILCNGDSTGLISVSAIGGTGSEYTYNLNGSDQESGDISMLIAGEYVIIASDSVGCTGTDTVNITQPEVIDAEAQSIIDVNCMGDSNGSVEISVTGGTEPYQYLLNTDTVQSGSFSGLTAGNYIVNVIDANDCNTSVMFDIATTSDIQLEAFPENIACFGQENGSITLESQNTSGTPLYSINGEPAQTENIFLNLEPGDYTVVVTDDTGCEAIINTTITEPTELLLDVEVTSNVSCKGGDDGQAVFNTSGGVGPYFYQMDGNNTAPDGLQAGDYNVSVTDNNGCVKVAQFSITEPEMALDITYEINGTEVTVNGIGGTGPYLYSFDGGDFTSDNKVIHNSDIIKVIIQDANGCTETLDIVLNSTNELAVNWEINAYPIPMIDQLTLDINFNKPLDASIQIFDIKGRLVNNISSKKYQSGENSVKIDVSNFASSIYIVKIASAEGYRYIKLIKS